MVDKSGKEGATVQFSADGKVFDEVAFKASTGASLASITDGAFVYEGRYAISHVDLCMKPAPEEAVAQEVPACDCGEAPACQDYACVDGECVLSNLEDGTGCGDLGEGLCQLASTCSNGQCKDVFKEENTPCG